MVHSQTLRVRLAPKVVAVAALCCLTLQAPAAQEAVRTGGLARLKSGNERFVKNASASVSLGTPTREALAKPQNPFAMVLSCSDSRVPPEYIFSVGLGDLLVIRSAGEVLDKSVMASLEYGARHLNIPLLVVMGHESCDAVQTAIDSTTVEGPNLQYLVKAIRAGTDRSASEKKELRGAVLANVEQVINDAMTGSQILRRGVSEGTLQIVGAYYEVGTGRVMFSESVVAPATTARK
jgi:carbonic anhydrase